MRVCFSKSAALGTGFEPDPNVGTGESSPVVVPEKGDRTMLDQNTIDWEIELVRCDIASDKAELSSKGLNSKQRKAIRNHLQMNILALRQLLGQEPVKQTSTI